MVIQTMSTHVAPRRRSLWPRYSLRTLFVLITVVCVVLGLWMHRVVRQRTAVRRFYELTANRPSDHGEQLVTMGYRYRGDTHSKPIVEEWLHPLRDLIGEEAFGEITLVQLINTPATNDDLRFLADVPTVEEVALHGTQVTDEGLRHLQACPHLRSLGLNGTSITDQGLAYLPALSELDSLSLDYTKVTDAGLVHLEKLPKLKELWLHGTAVTDAGYRRLQAALPQCRIQADVPAYHEQYRPMHW